MKKVEILSPVGSIENFYAAINSGADAVYLGLPKFNARMKADNITEDNIRELIKYAHLRDCKVYVTLNTIVWDEEIDDLLKAIDLLVSVKVDAFIVQDYATISTLTTKYKGLEIHASTQMGVHNLEGALVLEKMGVSRVVLSRETKLSDIKAIRENTNLEIEYFVQGALCVAFSGNCYFSACRTGASGNRGECKQLCRMPYTAQIDDTEIDSGYLLSARDLNLLPRLSELIEAGVTSFKIEGRLRRASFVSLATSIYKDAVTKVLKGKTIDVNKYTKDLAKVFNRGKYVTAYLDSGVPNDVINKYQQNHVGQKIGTVERVSPFKTNLYKIELKLQTKIVSGDGLKFMLDGKEVGSLGVGNVDMNGNNYVIYNTRKVAVGADVHLCVDYTFESNLVPSQKTIGVSVSFTAHIGGNPTMSIRYNDKVVATHSLDVVLDEARTTPITSKDVLDTIYKLDKQLEVKSTNVDIGNVFMAKSQMNTLRREVESKFIDKLLNFKESHLRYEKVDTPLNSLSSKAKVIDKDIALVYDDYDTSTIQDKYIAVSFRVFTENSLLDYMHKGNFSSDYPLYVNMPTIANGEDVAILNKMLSKVDKSKIVLIANNIYTLYYISLGYRVLASNNLNVANHMAFNYLLNFGVESVVWSIENEYTDCGIGYDGNVVLMTLAHCPYKTIYGNTCDHCSYAKNLSLCTPTSKYKVDRVILSQCYFTLTNDECKYSSCKYSLIDYRVYQD